MILKVDKEYKKITTVTVPGSMSIKRCHGCRRRTGNDADTQRVTSCHWLSIVTPRGGCWEQKFLLHSHVVGPGSARSVMLGVLSSFPPPAEGVRRLQPGTEAVLSGQKLGSGTLYIAESRLSWLNGSGQGFSLEYPSISLHAISRDTAAYPEEHLYVMVNTKLAGEGRKVLEVSIELLCTSSRIVSTALEYNTGCNSGSVQDK
ncbi:hypothetical protein GDO81_028637 [Engystomops pustulosus]|uniref:Methylosome subunit pICln n=1 Tax=Engystomops pustulosus TaxID=76066 RepID=A0AAV6Z0D7_ENGPU|nr:hypothetical protein GDO81_028637 [Engystomops pustulosus]